MNKITDQLWIGDQIDATQRPLHAVGISRVVTICQTENHMTDEQFPIDDGPHEYDTFAGAVDASIEAFEAGETVFVHCHAGQSRSVCASAAALAVTRGESIGEALDTIRAERTVFPSPYLMRSARRYVDEADVA